MPRPDKSPGADGQRKNENLFRVYMVFVAIAALLALSLPTTA